MGSLKQASVKGVFWSAVDKFSSKGIQLVFGILIARELLPEDYGAIALLQVFLSIASTLIDSGFGNALVRNNNRTEEDENTVFYFNIIVSVFCFLLLFLGAPAIARFYKIPELIQITRVVSLSLIINSFSGIQNARLTIDLNFKAFAKVSIINSTVCGLVTLYLAHIGWGVWALVAQTLLSSVLYLILIWFQSKWLPKLIFSWESFRSMFSYGSKLMISSLINSLYNSLYTLVIGKAYSSEELGEFSKSQTFASFPSSNISSVVMSVTFPVLCKVQEDHGLLYDYYRRMIKIMAFAVFPAMMGVSAIAKPLVISLLTESWSGMIPYLHILPIAYIFAPLHSMNTNLLKVLGRSDYFLRIAIIKKFVGLAVLVGTMPFGVKVMCWGCLLDSIITLVINTYYTEKFLGYGFWKQIGDIIPTMILCFVMWLIVINICELVTNPWLSICIGVLVGIIVYLSGAIIFKFSELRELIDLLKEGLKKK